MIGGTCGWVLAGSLDVSCTQTRIFELVNSSLVNSVSFYTLHGSEGVSLQCLWDTAATLHLRHFAF
jgi:hypothetical protein